MLLLGGRFIGISGFLDVHDKLSLRLILIHRTCGVVHIITVNIVVALPCARTGVPVLASNVRNVQPTIGSSRTDMAGM